jgi:micrococcal nuclease
MQKEYLYLYKGKILNWYDGDTLTIDVDLGFKIHSMVRVRLVRINSWEINAESSYRRRFARHARMFAVKNFPVGSTVYVSSKRKDRYGRWLAEVETKDGINISTFLLESGETGFEEYRG